VAPGERLTAAGSLIEQVPIERYLLRGGSLRNWRPLASRRPGGSSVGLARDWALRQPHRFRPMAEHYA